MGNTIIEILEIGFPQSIIQRENNPITELIHTHVLVEEINEQLKSIKEYKNLIDNLSYQPIVLYS
jgi:hypothetical protein